MMATHVRFPIDETVRADLGKSVRDYFDASEIPLTLEGKEGADEETVRLIVWQPAAVEIMVRPIFGGTFFFSKSPGAQLTIKPNGDIDVDATGTLAVKRYDLKELTKEGIIPVVNRSPMVAWYHSVRLSVRFLLRLPTIMKRGNIPVRVPVGDPPFSYNDKDAERRLIQYFFDGTLGIPFNASDLDGDMPTFDFTAKGGKCEAELAVRLAVERRKSAKPDFIPLEKHYEFISPRLYLRYLVDQKFILLPPSDPVADLVLGGERTLGPWRIALEGGLAEVGILLVSEDAPAGKVPIQWALREFQVYASQPNIAEATDDPNFKFGVKRIVNNYRYSRIVSGDANRDTRRALSGWQESGYRCPIITFAFSTRDIKNDIPNAEPKAVNFWKRSKPDDWEANNLTFAKRHRVFAADLVGFFGSPIDRIEFNNIIKIGNRTYFEWESEGKTKSATGPVGSNPGKREAIPENVLNKTTAAVLADPVLKSRFRVFRAVCEQESQGYLDIHNAYDDAFLSLAPFHWSMAAIGAGETELGAFILEMKNFPDLADKLRGWGIDAIPSKSKQLGPKKLASLCFLTDDGVAVPVEKSSEGSYLSSWHVYTRFLSLSRYDPNHSYGKAAWAMAMYRINGILSSQWSRDLKFKDVITSELLVAAIVRAHVFRPSWIISNGMAGEIMVAMKAAVTNGDQTAMFAALLKLLEDAGKKGKDDATSLLNSLKRMQKPGAGSNFKIDRQLRLLDGVFNNGDANSGTPKRANGEV